MSHTIASAARNAPRTFRCAGHPRLPRGLAEEAEVTVFAEPSGAVAQALANASDSGDHFWQALAAVYAPTSGPLRLGHWESVGDERLNTRLRTYRATLAFGDRIDTVTACAAGPVAALTTMLYDRRVAVELLQFHQFVDHDATTTFIRGSDGHRAAWAMGFCADAGESARRAVIACANRLLAADWRRASELPERRWLAAVRGGDDHSEAPPAPTGRPRGSVEGGVADGRVGAHGDELCG